MLERTLVLLGAGPLPELSMRCGAETLSDTLGLPLTTVAEGQSPDPSLVNLMASPPRLIRLAGDPGSLHHEGSSWMDALAAWKCPVILLGSPRPDGVMPGTIPAFTSLCETRGMVLLGLIQLGGLWLPEVRKRDGLPWLGWLSDSRLDRNRPDQCDAAVEAVDRLSIIIRSRLEICHGLKATEASSGRP